MSHQTDGAAVPGPLLDALRAAVGPSQVLLDADLRATYETDWSRRFHGGAAAVVRPGSVDEVAGEVTAGAGVTLGALQERVRRAGWDFGVDMGSRDSATIGGMVATNAGGMNVVRHGPMRQQVVGYEAVLADGSVIRRLPGLVKDNTGYGLGSLLAGSEGTLAVVTRVRLRLVPMLPGRAVAVLAVDDAGQAAAFAAHLRRRLASLNAAELFDDDGMRLVLGHTGGEAPFRDAHPRYLLVECAAASDPTDELVEAISALPSRDAVVASDEGARHRLWILREGHTESINAAGVPHKLDVSVPISRIGEYDLAVREAIRRAAPAGRTYIYGHVGDGNLHVNVLGPDPDDEAVDDAILSLAISFGGAVSAEHGIGVAKVRWLAADRGPGDLAAMRAIKRALDPGNVLNPGVLFAH